MKNPVIINTFDLFDYLKCKFNITANMDNVYYSIIQQLKLKLVNDKITLDDDLRNHLVNYLKSLDLLKFIRKINIKNNYYLESNNYINFEDAKDSIVLLEDADTKELFEFVLYVLNSVTYLKKDNLLLLKYNRTTPKIGWNNFNSICRGRIIDLNTLSTIVHPFDKFFLYNTLECPKETVLNALNQKVHLYLMNKEDGTAVYVTKLSNGEILINTNTSFDNSCIDIAKKLLSTKYKYFFDNLSSGFTYMFELISPENKLVIDYGNKELMYLLAIRDLNSDKLLLYEDVKKLSIIYSLDIVNINSFSSLEKLIKESQTLINANKEGWVLRIVTKTNDLFVKIKTNEYLKLSSLLIKADTTYLDLYRIDMLNKLDDISISNVLPEMKDKISNMIKTYRGMSNFYIEKGNYYINSFVNKYNFTFTDFQNAKYDVNTCKKCGDIYKLIDKLKIERNFKNAIKYYYSSNNMADIHFRTLSAKNFNKLVHSYIK